MRSGVKTARRFSNNGFTYENCELLIIAIAGSKVSRLFFDWNPIPSPKKKPAPEPAVTESLFPRLYTTTNLNTIVWRTRSWNTST